MKIKILLCALVAGLIRAPEAVQAVEPVEQQPVRVISADWQKSVKPRSEIFANASGPDVRRKDCAPSGSGS